jgi:Ser/Thr protein kinase RdoA (MazF antagonist)
VDRELAAHLEGRYGIRVADLGRLEDGVYRVTRRDGPGWVARVFAAERPVERAEGDAEILHLLETHDFPAERCAQSDAVTTLDGRAVLVTRFVTGVPAGGDPATLATIGSLLGRLHTLPVGEGAATREAGSLHHSPGHEGGPGEDLAAALGYLASIEDRVPDDHRDRFDSLRAQVAGADDCAGLPVALIHPDAVLRNVIVSPDAGPVFIDWTAAGRGPRLASLAAALFSVALIPGGWDPRRVDALLAGYRARVVLGADELDRLAGALAIRPLWFACSMYRLAMASGRPPSGTEWWWHDQDLVDAVAARARRAAAGTD